MTAIRSRLQLSAGILRHKKPARQTFNDVSGASVQQHARQMALLLPTAPRKNAARDEDWKIFVNAEVEPEQ